MRIDLVNKEAKDKSDEKIVQTVVRLQARTFNQFLTEHGYKILDEYSYEIASHLTYKAICAFCEEYQNTYPKYEFYTRNCRVFMIELCKFLKIPFPLKYFGEEVFYHCGQKYAKKGGN